MESSRDLESGPSRPLQRTFTTGAFSDVMDPEVVPSSLAAIAPILRVANEIEKEAPRVAYLCRFYAFDKAHKIDPSSSGRGVRQFKTALLHKLEQDDEITLKQRTARNDAREMQMFYQRYYDNYVKALGDKAGDTIDRARLTKSYQTASVLFDVLMAVNQHIDPAELGPEIMQAAKDVEAKVGVYVAYNILPLDPAGKSQAIMRLPEINLAVMALRKTRGLPFKEEDKSEFDLLDWLQLKFGFQKANVANQREHLILLLANVHKRMVSAAAADPYKMLNEAALTHVMDNLFKSYRRWCKFLGRPDNFSTPSTQQDKQQHYILYIGLYLLIWGEAANLRFMPESLCYIFHHMAFELRGMVTGVVSPVTGENVEPAYGVGSEDKYSFLDKVVTPLYNVIAEEVSCNKNGMARHSAWRNYDDLNEYFWNVDCFRLGWPMKIKSADFFKGPTPRRSSRQVGKEKSESKEIGSSGTKKKRNAIEKEPSWVGKTNFVEVRSFWHIFRSFDRMWSFFILTLQALIIIAWSGTGSITDVFRGSVLKNVLSVFITAAILRLLQASVDIGLSCKAWRSMRYMEVLRYILKVIVAFAWVIILPVCYAHTWGKSIGWLSILNTWFGESINSYLYVIAILVYLAPDAFSALMFCFPVWRRKLEKFDHGMVQLLLWWAQPPLLIGRGMHDDWFILFKYTFFWVLAITSKLLFSFYVEIKPLIKPTRDFMTAPTEGQYQWHELFPKASRNMGAVVTLWSPIIMVYFMDMQIWYAIWSTIVGGVIGAYSRLGEIRTFAILRTRFDALPKAINDNLIPSSSSKGKARHKVSMLSKGPNPLDRWSSLRTEDASDHEKLVEPEKDQRLKELELAKFSQIWNMVIETLYEEDYINIKERELLLMPFVSPNKYIQWPPFLLANKVALALDTVKDLTNENSDAELLKRVEKDNHLLYALRECYDLFKSILFKLTKASQEKGLLDMIFKDIDQKIDEGTFIKAHKMKELPMLYKKIVELVKILKEQDDTKREQVTYLLQDIYEVYQKDIRHEEMSLDSRHGSASKPDEGVLGKIEDLSPQLFEKNSILYPPSSEDKNLMQQIKRLHLLLTIEESAMDIPSNLQARRRITFFTNSVFMDMPPALEVRNMLSFSVLTPYFAEEILYTQKGLEEENEDGVSILFYLQKIYPDEWKNFQQRTGCPSEKFWDNKEFSDSVRKWASYRAQTLTRTVRGMMYYRKALELQAFFDMAPSEEILAGYQKLATGMEDERQHSLWSNIQAIADLKFTYVATCQRYGVQKRSKDPKAGYILQLMKEHPALRVAYIDEVEAGKNEGEIGKSKEYFSVLVKGNPESDSDQEIYRIKLPGQPILGEGKPENQNHAIIFTRGEALQAIDMNQDNYLEEALKMRNLLEEFNQKNGLDSPSILGMREHIFTGSVSSLAGFMSNQESSFVTIGQRVLANPLRVRFHYGHPDVFDRLFHIANGGISKASKGVNLSEDIFAGFNTTLRGGIVTHHEYIQVGKGRDVGLNQISMFEAKIANGNGEQTMSRDVYRLGHRLDFFRMLSVYFTTVGFYISTMIVVLTVYVFLYGRVYLALSGVEASLTHFAGLTNNTPLEAALASQSFVQIGLLMAFPMFMEIGLEHGFRRAFSELIIMQLQLASVFFTFSMGTKVHFYGRTLLHGGTKYRYTGRGFVVFHAKFAENYRLYSRSHFVKGLELLILLIVYNIYGATVSKTVPYLLITSSLWFLVGTWLFAPFLFNPSGFEWQKIVDDWDDWTKWVNNRGGIGVAAEKSWESWWEEERSHLDTSGFRGKLFEIILSARFLLYQYGLVYHLHISQHDKSILVYGLSWVVMLGVLVILKVVSAGRRQFKADFQIFFRLLKVGLLAATVTVLSVLFVVENLTIGDIFVSLLAFLPSGWTIIQIAQTCKPACKKIGLWGSVKGLARCYEYLMGLLLFAPVAALAWFPFISDFQTRLLFNQAFSRGLQISRILAGRKEKKTN